MLAGRTGETFTPADEDYFADMDGGYKRATDPAVKPLDVEAARGRNMWIVWTGGNDRFWDYMANNTLRRVRPLEDIVVESKGWLLQRSEQQGVVRRVAIQPDIQGRLR